MDLTDIALQIGSLLIAFSLHEAGHAYCAKHLGDDTAEQQGRLTLNPLPHLDPFGSVLLPLILIFVGSPLVFAAAKPVPVNPNKLRRPIADFAIVALAGPMVNILLALLAAFALGLWLPMAGEGDGLGIRFLIIFIWINVVLALFNLLPIPPLDGSKIIAGLMPRPLARRWLNLERFGFLFLMMFIVASFVLPFSLLRLWIEVLANGLLPVLQAVSGIDFFSIFGFLKNYAAPS